MATKKPAAKQPKRAHRTRYGEGSFRYVESRGLWTGRYDTGEVNNKGTRIIITASSRDEDEAWRKFIAAKKKYMIEGKQLDGLKANQTVRGWAAEWLKMHESRVRSGTYNNDRSNLKLWILPQVGGVKLAELTAAHMRKVGDAPRSAGRSLSAANTVQRTFNKMLVAARADGYKVPDRVFAARKIGVGKSERASMSKPEVQAVFRKAYEVYPDAVRLFMAVLYGSRQSEVLGLTWDRVRFFENPEPGSILVGEIDISWQVQQLPYYDRAKGVFHIPDGEEAVHIVGSWHFTEPKTAAGARKLPLIAPVAEELLKWREVCPTGDLNPHNLVFPRVDGLPRYRGHPRNKKRDSEEWRKAQELAGVYKRKPDPKNEDDEGEFYVLHEARHSMISMLSDAKVPKHIIELIVGQTTLVEGYVHGSIELAGAAIQDVMAPLLPRA